MTASANPTAGLRGATGVRIAAVCGVLWPVLAITRLFLTGEVDRPDWTDAPSSIVEFYTSSTFDTVFVVGIGLVIVAYLLLLVFIAKVAELIRSHERGAPWLGTSIVAFAIVEVGFTAIYLISFAAAVFWASHGGVSDDAYLTLHGLSFGSYWFALPTDLLIGLSFGGAILTTRLFPRWLGWAMIITGIAEAVTWFMRPDAWNATSGLPYLWILTAAVIMLTNADRYTSK